MNKQAVLLVNLGSPDAPDVPSVRTYLNEFLMDPYVIQLPWLLRRLIVSLFVLPKRPASSAHAYQSVWTERGSPLVALSKDLVESVQQYTDANVKLAMRYGSPSIESVLSELAQEGAEKVSLIPLYPHYAESTVTTVIEKARQVIADNKLPLELDTFGVFYNNPEYIKALVSSAQPWLQDSFDHVLFSYHGLPELHLKKADPTGKHCLQSADCCSKPSTAHATCYRHQVLETTRLFVEATGLTEDQYSVAFQSRLGRAKWLEPATDNSLSELAGRGVKKLLVLCPAFVTDCLETLEEIGLQGTEQFKEAGGEELVLVPCLNSHPEWAKTLAAWSEEQC